MIFDSYRRQGGEVVVFGRCSFGCEDWSGDGLGELVACGVLGMESLCGWRAQCKFVGGLLVKSRKSLGVVSVGLSCTEMLRVWSG